MRWFTRGRSEDGAQLVEFALVLPLLLLVVLGIAEFGFIFQRYEVVTNAAREGARMAVLPGYTDTLTCKRACRSLLSTPAACPRPSTNPTVLVENIVDPGVAAGGRRSARGASRSPTPTPFSF